jgi:hypothetical protein
MSLPTRFFAIASSLLIAGLSERAFAQQAEAAPAPTPTTFAVETDLTLGIAGSGSFAYNPARESAAELGGPYFALGATMRSLYFVAPYFEIAYYPIFTSTPSSGTTTAANLSALSIALGPSVDVTPWLRVRGELSFFRTFLEANVGGTAVTPARWNLGWSIAASVRPVAFGRIRMGPELTHARHF